MRDNRSTCQLNLVDVVNDVKSPSDSYLTEVGLGLPQEGDGDLLERRISSHPNIDVCLSLPHVPSLVYADIELQEGHVLYCVVGSNPDPAIFGVTCDCGDCGIRAVLYYASVPKLLSACDVDLLGRLSLMLGLGRNPVANDFGTLVVVDLRSASDIDRYRHGINLLGVHDAYVYGGLLL